MAKLTYLQLTNRVLKRINESTISEVTTATGKALIVTELINEAQNELWTETNWYSLYTTRTFATVASTATYAVASDWGRTIDLMDTTNNLILQEDTMRAFDESDPDADTTGNPTHFAIQGAYYLLHPIPAGAYTIRDRYWKIPTTLSANGSQSDLPIECENSIIHWTWYKILEYLGETEKADRTRIEFERLLKRARVTNDRMIDKLYRFSPRQGDGIGPPRFPSHYGWYWRR